MAGRKPSRRLVKAAASGVLWKNDPKLDDQVLRFIISERRFDPFAQNTALSESMRKLAISNKHQINPVSWMYERLGNYVAEFEESLNESEEVGAHLVSFGHEIVFHISDISYHGPDMITFEGFNDQGRRVQLIQHYTQLSVLLIALPKLGAEARRIGFRLKEKEDDN